MARYKNGINGNFSGKVGSVVGVTWMGMPVMRSLPDVTGNKATAAQLYQRSLLAMVSSWLRPLKELIWIGFKHLALGKSPMNSAVSFIMKQALITENGETRIDFPKAIFSRGELLISIIKEIIALVSALLRIKWDNASASIFNNDDDKATIVVYNPSKEAFVTFENVAQRGDKEVVLQLPPTYTGDTVHCWQHFVNEKGDMISTTVYLGEVVVA